MNTTATIICFIAVGGAMAAGYNHFDKENKALHYKNQQLSIKLDELQAAKLELQKKSQRNRDGVASLARKTEKFSNFVANYTVQEVEGAELLRVDEEIADVSKSAGILGDEAIIPPEIDKPSVRAKNSYKVAKLADNYKTGFLGVRYKLNTNNTSRRGAYIESIIQGSPASYADIRSGDIIKYVDGVFVENEATLTKVIKKYYSGDTVRITINRRGADRVKKVKLSGRMVQYGFNFYGPLGDKQKYFEVWSDSSSDLKDIPLRNGDKIYRINGAEIQNLSDVRRIIKYKNTSFYIYRENIFRAVRWR